MHVFMFQNMWMHEWERQTAWQHWINSCENKTKETGEQRMQSASEGQRLCSERGLLLSSGNRRRTHNWIDVQDWKTQPERRSVGTHCGGGKQRGFDGVEHDDVTESFSYAKEWQALMNGWHGEQGENIKCFCRPGEDDGVWRCVLNVGQHWICVCVCAQNHVQAKQ